MGKCKINNLYTSCVRQKLRKKRDRFGDQIKWKNNISNFKYLLYGDQARIKY